VDTRLTTLLCKKIVRKSREVKTGCNLAESFREGYDLKQGDALSPLLFKLYFRICHYEGPGKPGGTQMGQTHQLLVYADDVNLKRDNIDTIKKNINFI
jgi:hypothetical protein